MFYELFISFPKLSIIYIYISFSLQPVKDEQWARAMEYVNAVSELNYMTQIVIMMYEDPTKVGGICFTNMDPSMDKYSHIQQSVEWNYLSIHQLQWLHRWSLGMYK